MNENANALVCRRRLKSAIRIEMMTGRVERCTIIDILSQHPEQCLFLYGCTNNKTYNDQSPLDTTVNGKTTSTKTRINIDRQKRYIITQSAHYPPADEVL